MKKILLVFSSVIIIVMLSFYSKYKESIDAQSEAASFNKEYEFYNKESILGTDITTIINKATNNNEQYGISKDSKGLYVQDEEYCIKIYVKMDKKYYPMEAFNEVGLKDFTQYFGSIEFKCSQVEYHDKTQRISKMVFEEI